MVSCLLYNVYRYVCHWGTSIRCGLAGAYFLVFKFFMCPVLSFPWFKDNEVSDFFSTFFKFFLIFLNFKLLREAFSSFPKIIFIKDTTLWTHEKRGGFKVVSFNRSHFKIWTLRFSKNLYRPHPVRGLKLGSEECFYYLKTKIVFNYRYIVWGLWINSGNFHVTCTNDGINFFRWYKHRWDLLHWYWLNRYILLRSNSYRLLC